MIITSSVLVVFSVILIIIAYFKWTFNYWKRRDVITLKPQIPFGNFTKIALKKDIFINIYTELYKTFKSQGYKYVGYYFLTTPVLVIFDPQIIKKVLVQNFSHFTDHSFYIDEERDPFSVNLLTSQGEKWKKMRDKLSPVFSPGKIKMLTQNLIDVSDRLKLVLDESAQNSKTINICNLAGKYTTDAIGNCVLGFDCNSLQGRNDEIRKYLKEMLGETLTTQIKVFFAFFWHAFFRLFNVHVLSSSVENFFFNLTNTIISQREAQNLKRNDLMQMFMDLRNNKAIDDENFNKIGDKNKVDANKSLSVTEIAAQCAFFYLAGYETSTATTSLLMYELVGNKEIYNKLKKEIETVSEKHNNEITYNSIQDMTYLDQCVNETLRKYPATAFIFRKCTKEFQLSDSFKIEKNTQIHIPLMELHRDPEYFPQPAKFDPERFAAENKSNINQYTYMPFGEGPRLCLGLRLGLLQVKVAIVTMVKNFNFSLNEKTKEPLRMDNLKFIPTVLDGIWLNVEKVRA